MELRRVVAAMIQFTGVQSKIVIKRGGLMNDSTCMTQSLFGLAPLSLNSRDHIFFEEEEEEQREEPRRYRFPSSNKGKHLNTFCPYRRKRVVCERDNCDECEYYKNTLAKGRE